MNDTILSFRPFLLEKIWGGDFLTRLYGKQETKEPVGEAWLISALPGKSTTVVSEDGHETSLETLYRENPVFFATAGPRFPFLAKIIDAADKLSIQVHPTDAYATKHGQGCGKSECWFVLESGGEGKIVAGHKAETGEELREAILNKRIRPLIREEKVRKGDFIRIPAGLIHAIGAGVRVVEIQDPSDTTFRIDDYGRTDKTGKSRELMLHEASEAALFARANTTIEHTEGRFGIFNLVRERNFSVDRWKTEKGLAFDNRKRENIYFIATEGQGTVNNRFVRTGDAIMITGQADEITVEGNIGLLAIRSGDRS